MTINDMTWMAALEQHKGRMQEAEETRQAAQALGARQRPHTYRHRLFAWLGSLAHISPQLAPECQPTAHQVC